MPRCICLISACHQAASVAASVRIYGVPSPWLLCDEHATMLDHPHLPTWLQVDHVCPVSNLSPQRAQEGVTSRVMTGA